MILAGVIKEREKMGYIIYIIFVLLHFLLLFVLSGRCRGQPGCQKPLGRMAVYLYETGSAKGLFRAGQVEESICLLHPGHRKSDRIKSYYTKKIKRILLIIFLGNAVLAVIFAASIGSGFLKEGSYIQRNQSGEGEVEVGLDAKLAKDETLVRNIQITVPEKKYEEAAIKSMAMEAGEKLEDLILGENTSLNEVRSSLRLVQEIEGYPFTVLWESDNYGVVYSDGTVVNEKIKDPGIVVELTAFLVYDEYRESCIIPVRICAPQLTYEQQWKKLIQEALEIQNVEQIYEDKLYLPERIQGVDVDWFESESQTEKWIIFLIFGAAVAAYFTQDREIQRKAEDRNRQMMLDYPGIVQKLTLYMGAGMTTKSAFQKIAFDYRKKRKEETIRYAYEEMLIACHELESGLSESQVYEQYGKRCKVRSYTRLGSLLSQNLKKGNSGLLAMLREEAKNAFEDRKYTAKKLGEEAGTKLLLPMMLMLGIVMVLIIVPAYFSFSL